MYNSHYNQILIYKELLRINKKTYNQKKKKLTEEITKLFVRKRNTITFQN